MGVPNTPVEAAENMQKAIAEVLPPPPVIDLSNTSVELPTEEETQVAQDEVPVEPEPEV
jgi:hypothetical protein